MTSLRFKLAVFALWAAMTAWFIRYEAFPEAFSHLSTGYRSVFAQGQYVLDSWMQIYFKDAPIGYSHTWVDSKPEEPDEPYIVRNQTVAMLNVLGQSQRINMVASAFLDIQYRLRRFTFFMSSGLYTVRIEGTSAGDENFDIAIHTASGVQRRTLRIPQNTVLYSPVTQAEVGRMKPGGEMRVRTLDPVTLTVSDVTIKALRRELFERGGTNVDALVLSIAFQGMESTAWVDRRGDTLRQETPFGWVMVAKPMDQILASELSEQATIDMLKELSVPCAGQIVDPRARPELRVRIRGLALGWIPWQDGRQRVETTNKADVVMRVLAQRPPRTEANDTPPAELAEFLAPSAFIQSADRRIIERAREIIGQESDSWEKARLIGDWVHRSIEKVPTVSLPSALEVLRFRQGDCNEHTYLFVALARAAGLPARVHVGLLYNDGAFYYHAWPGVFVGEWVEMDPTLGQETVDATHITLLTGEIADQMRLGGIIGKLAIEVLAEPEN